MINTDPNHKHTYDAQGRMTCCSLEEKVYTKAGAKKIFKKEHSDNQHDHDHEEEDHEGHDHEHNDDRPFWQQYLPVGISLTLLLIGILIDNVLKLDFFKSYVRFLWYAVTYIPVGFPVMKEAFEAMKERNFSLNLL